MHPKNEANKDMSGISSEVVEINGSSLCLHRWPAPGKPRGLAVVFHGFLAHGLYPTVRYAADRLADAGFAVVSCDLKGHGRSEGLSGYLEGADALIEDACAILQYVKTNVYPNLVKVFLVGSSMGGTIALSVAQKQRAGEVTGVVLLAPMLQLSVSDMARMALAGLAMLAPTWQIIPSSSTSAEQQYRDPIKRKECEDDEFTKKNSSAGTIRVGSALTCVELASRIQENFSSVQVPFLVLMAEEDCVVKNQGSLDLMEKAVSEDKTIKRYPALHGLLCEPKPLVDEIEKDMLDWMHARS